MVITLPSTWPSAKVAQVAQVIMGQAPIGESYNENEQGVPLIAGASDLGAYSPHPKRWTTKPGQLCKVDDLLYCIRATIGNMNWADKEYCLGRGVAALRANQEVVDKYYLYYWLLVNETHIANQASGSTFIQIRRQDLEDLLILLPPLPEQRRIVAILRQADELRQLRREADDKAQGLLQALFYEMFGDCDPHKEYPLGWQILPLAKLVTHTQYGLSTNMKESGDIAVLRMNNITLQGALDFSDLKYLSSGEVNFEQYDLRPGDILFNRTNSKELVGKTGIWEGQEGKYTFASYIIRMRVQDTVSPEYIWMLLNSPYGKQQVFALGKQAINMANINVQELGSIPIVLPPQEVQERFTKAYKIFRDRVRHSNTMKLPLDTLFQSLLAQAFSGELTAAWREKHSDDVGTVSSQLSPESFDPDDVEQEEVPPASLSAADILALFPDAPEIGLIQSAKNYLQETLTFIEKVQTRPDALIEISPKQLTLLKSIFKVQGYFTFETIQVESKLSPYTVRDGLQLFSELGIIQKVALPDRPVRDIVYISAYRTLTEATDEVRQSDRIQLEEMLEGMQSR